MEAREFKLDVNQKDPAQLTQEEQRLKAIKQILVGNQIERLENRFRGLSRRVESTNGHLLSTVQDLSNEFNRLKSEMQLQSPKLAGDSKELQKTLQELLKDGKGAKFDDSAICKQLEERINTIEDGLKNEATLQSESKEQMTAMSEDIKNFKEKLRSTQDRLTKLDRVASPENKAKVDQRLSSLEAKIQSLNPKKMEARINKRQDEFEDGVQDLVERLAGRVNERFDFAAKGRKKLADNQEALTASQNKLVNNQETLSVEQDKLSLRQNDLEKHQEALIEQTLEVMNNHGQLKGRVDSIQEILENDIMNFLQNVKVDKGDVEAHVKNFAGDLERKIYENNVRMEAKIDAFIDMSRRQMGQAAPQPVQEDPKMKAIKDTLKKLSSLLDE